MAWTRRRFLAATGATLSTTSLWARSGDVLQVEGPAFGATWRIRVYVGADAGRISATVTHIIAEVDNAMSPFKPESEISRFNRMETLNRVPLCAATIATLKEAKRVAGMTHGAFDPTLGGIVGRFGFGPITQKPAGVFAKLSLNDLGVRKSDPSQTLDLCGIAKGYALDRIVAGITALGYADVFVELGGEVRAQGHHPSGRLWRTGIESPLAKVSSVQHVVEVRNEALATSGDRVNSFVFGDRRYSHIVDPERHQSADTPLASVSVFNTQAITADALATALFAMGPEVGVAFAEREQIPALFIIRDGNRLREKVTADFSKRFAG